MRLSPVVSDNTRVAIDHKIVTYNKAQAEVEDYNPYKPELMVNDKAEFYYYLFQVIGTGQKRKENRKSANPSFLKNLNDQKIMAETFLNDAYSGVPLLKIELDRKDIKKTRTTGGGQYSVPQTHTWWENSGSPAIMRLVQNKAHERTHICRAGKFRELKAPSVVAMVPAITFPSFNTIKIDEDAIKCVVDEVISVARVAVGQKHAKFDKTQMEIFCGADFADYSGNDDYKTLFKSVTVVRSSIVSDQANTPQEMNTLQTWDDELKKDTRYWHEAVNEDIIEPMLWVGAAVFILATIIVSWLGSAGTLAPATVALIIMLVDVADIAITGASLYFKGMTNFYELPAQAKFQKSLAVSQIDDNTFTTFDQVKASESHIEMGKMMMGFEALFAPIVGAQFSQSAKRFTGITGKKAMMRFGMPVRHFGQPPKSTLIKRSIKTLRKEFGIVGALTRKTSDMVHNAKRWMPRYQAYTADELAGTVRIGLVRKATEAGLDSKPWDLLADVNRMVKRIDDRLVKSVKYTDELDGAVRTFKTEAKLTFKELLTNPFYNKELFIPKTFIRAMRKGGLKAYVNNFGDVMVSLNKLRTRFVKGKAEKLKNIISKLEDVKLMSQKNPGYLKENGFSNYFDYFQSTLSKEEIQVLREISKYERNIVKMISGNYQGKAHVFTRVFKDHDRIMDTIEPLTATLNGSALKASKYYKNAVTQVIKESVDDIDSELRNADDLIEFYESMLKHDAVENVQENMIIINRGLVEDALY
jgi:hypothetical protein